MIPRSALMAALLLALPMTAHPNPVPPKSPDPPKAPPKVEVVCIDDSTLKLEILDPFVVLKTKYGSLQIPAADIRKIEFATRLPHLVEMQIKELVEKLAHPDYATREDAEAELKKIGARAYPAACKACKDGDPERARRAGNVAGQIRRATPMEKLKNRENDVVHTDDSVITGTLATEGLKVKTFQFGEQTLRLADIASLKSIGFKSKNDLSANAEAAPTNMMAFQNQFEKEMVYTVTGHQVQPGTTATVWGTDIYTLDSPIAVAAVHAGVLQQGEKGVVRVKIVASPPQFVATSKNGIGSTAYGNYPAGAYIFLPE